MTPATGPARIQRHRTRGWRKPKGAVIVDRTSRYGNPFRIVNNLTVQEPDTGKVWPCDSPDSARAQASRLFEQWLNGEGPDTYPAGKRRTLDRRVILAELAAGSLTGRRLACTCPLPEKGQPDHCHAQVLMRRAASAEQPAAPTREDGRPSTSCTAR